MAAHVVFNIRLEDDGTFKDNVIITKSVHSTAPTKDGKSVFNPFHHQRKFAGQPGAEAVYKHEVFGF